MPKLALRAVTPLALMVSNGIMKNAKVTQTTTKLSVSVADAAQAMGFSQNYVRLLISRRLLPHVRVGRAVRLILSDLEQFLQQHRQGYLE